MTNPFAKAFEIPDDTVWDWIHVYKACLLEEILRGRGAAGEFRELICFTRNEYYQQLGWMWFGVRMSTLDEVCDEHQTFFAHPVRSINLDDRNCDSSLANSLVNASGEGWVWR